MGYVTVGKWGNNLAVRIPGEVADAMHLREGDRMDVLLQDGQLTLRRAAPRTIAELFSGKTAEVWRAEYAKADDWGPDVGREVIPE